MKACIKCGVVKSLEGFYPRPPTGLGKRKPKGDGYRHDCKSCHALAGSAWSKKNPGAHAGYVKNWHAKNPGYNQEYVAANLEAQISRRKTYAKNNRHILSEISRRYSLAKRGAAPKWLDKGHRAEIKSMYKLAITKTRETGVPHQVDHIIPLQGKTVSGLHVPWNLQVVTATVNRQKSNKVITGEGV